MSYETAADAIRARFAANWSGTAFYPNQPFSEPPANSVWARLSILDTASQQRSLGSSGGRLVRRPGLIAVEIYAPKAQGDEATRQSMDSVRSAFEMTTFSGITTREMRVTARGEQNNWFRTDLFFEFWRDDTGI